MRTIVDLHIHSYYSRATSKKLTIAGIAKYAAIKGVDVIATGDITHPKWMNEIERDLEEDGSGFFRLRDGSSSVLFTLFGEIASVYTKHGRGRRVHTLFGVSSIAAARQVNKRLTDAGFNLAYDGRPIVGMDVKELAKIYLDADPDALIIPAHIWTPWFAVFGSKSGFDSLEECFEEMTPYIYGIETGLSSDPEMNWRVSALNNVTILSNSDAHSPEKIGREATVFDWATRTYHALYQSIKNQTDIAYTIEFYPEEGKYHLDGHRACHIQFTPQQTAKHKGVCPKCGLPLVVGVMNRVEVLADQTIQAAPRTKIPFNSIVPLPEIIADSFGVGVASKKVHTEFQKIIDSLGNEFHVLLDASRAELERVAQPIVAEAILRVRAGKLHINPGYDGVFGTVHVFTEAERATFQPKQHALF
ncbi:MAG: DNA helicase UvrD [Candidatus Kerfeldbacteria bacterium]|nr:DNA helicase UvrD [Candidatus Kerfeldbacteria bacterium]